ncbi:MAG: hypothetical protein ACU83V_07365 [Gammaproteobacteria bacterium]
MQDYVTIIQPMLTDWLQLTLANPWYATALIVAAFLLTAIVYGIRIIILKRKYAASELARSELQNNLALAQQQSAGLKEQLAQRGQRIVGTMQALIASFALDEHPLADGDDLTSDRLWQQHDRVITSLANRLRDEQQARIELQHAYQTETAKRAETEVRVESLQTALAEQTGLVSKLEQALQEQKTFLQEEQEKAQHILTQVVEKHMAETAHLAELEKQAKEWAASRLQLQQLEEKLLAKEAEVPHMQPETPAAPVTPHPVELEPARETSATSVTQAAYGIEAFREPEALENQESSPHAIRLPDWDEQEASPSSSEPEAAPPAREPASGVAGKFKNLFGKPKPESAAAAGSIAASPAAVEAESGEDDATTPSEKPAKGKLGKIKNLFSTAR